MNPILFLGRATLVCSLFLVGCSTTHQARDAETSGFLSDYSMLKEGKDGQALRTYRDPSAQWSQYSKIMIDPVSIYATQDADIKSDDKEERLALANYFSSTLNEKLKKHFTVVRAPGAGVLRLRVALTDADQSEVLLNTITTIMPIGLAVSTLKRVATGKDTAVGFAQAEMEISDSTTARRLAAAVDKRYGTKALRSKFGSWNDAEGAMDHWAEQISTALVEAGAGKP